MKPSSTPAGLRNVKYLLFYNFRSAKHLWDISGNSSLKGILISESKRLVYDISSIATAPVLEELLLFSNMNRKYTVKSLDPIKACKAMKRVLLVCNTESSDFDPCEFADLELFQYRVDGHWNFNY